MDSTDLEKLLEPLSEELPCGEDLEYDAEFGEMERAAQGKGEQQYGDTIVAAEPPEWKEVRKHVETLLERTKDMRVAVYLARCSLQLDGIDAFETALALLRGYVETFWETVHPELDRSDNDDPTYRINTLTTLCDEGTLLRELREAPIVASRAMGRFSLRDVEQARESSEKPAEETPEGQGAWAEGDTPVAKQPQGPTLSTIDAAFSDAVIEEIQATENATRLAAEHTAAIEQCVTQQVGAAQAVSLLPLENLLREMNKVIVAQLERRGVYADKPESETEDETAEEDHQSATSDNSTATPAGFHNGKISSRDDAIRVLDNVCEYYERNEPSSPLPLLIRRAQRLATKSFLDILRDLAPDAVPQAEALGGSGSVASAEESTEGESESSNSW
jgi:type VI secretion system protein ImpA